MDNEGDSSLEHEHHYVVNETKNWSVATAIIFDDENGTLAFLAQGRSDKICNQTFRHFLTFVLG